MVFSLIILLPCLQNGAANAVYVLRHGSPSHISGIESQINSKVIVKNTNTAPTRFNFRLPLDPGVRSEADYWEQESQLAALFYKANELQQRLLPSDGDSWHLFSADTSEQLQT